MVNNIYLFYTKDTGEVYSYLKNFFRSIGIWTQDEGSFTEDMIKIYIIDEKDSVKLPAKGKNCYYITEKGIEMKENFSEEKREDLIPLVWKKKSQACWKEKYWWIC